MSIADSVSATCPQMSRQQELVSRILMSTNRVFQGISINSQTNPESLTTLIDQPQRGLRIEAAMEAKWKSHSTVHVKSSVDFKGLTSRNSENSRQSQIGKLGKVEDGQRILPEIVPSSQLDQDSSDVILTTPPQVEELFPHSIVKSIGRRSSTAARILPTSVPTLCDSPVKLRIL